MTAPRDGRLISKEHLEKLRGTVIKLFAAGDFESVGMRDIAKQAGVGPATIYKYFGSKDELIFACIQPEMQALGQRLLEVSAAHRDGPTRDRFYAFAEVFIGFYVDHRQIGEIVYLTIPTRNWVENLKFIQTQQIGTGVEILRDGQQRGEVRSDASPELLIALLSGAVHRYMMHMLLEEPDGRTGREHAEMLFRLFWPMLESGAPERA